MIPFRIITFLSALVIIDNNIENIDIAEIDVSAEVPKLTQKYP